MKRILLWTGAGIGLAAIAALTILRGPIEQTHIRLSSAAAGVEPETRLSEEKPRDKAGGPDDLPPASAAPETRLFREELRDEAHAHDFLPATCTEPETCRVCGETRGEPKGHEMTAPTYEKPATCTRCGITDGEPLPAAMQDLTLNEMQVGVPVPYVTASYEDRAVDVTGTAEIVDYRVIAGDGTFPARDGYEWHVATVRLVFSGDDARRNGMQSALTYGDYYLFDNGLSTRADEDGMRRFFVDRCGKRVLCRQKSGPNEEADWYDRELRFTWREGVLVPTGYDGVLLILYHAGRFADAGPYPAASAVLDENALVFRMK